jgi:hypothetical protein
MVQNSLISFVCEYFNLFFVQIDFAFELKRNKRRINHLFLDQFNLIPISLIEDQVKIIDSI